MFRRRRPLKSEAINFSFDSFLDLVTNVVGIIIRLILVTWVGARSYHASMEWLDVETPPPETPALKASDDPLHARIEQSKLDLDDARSRLLEHLKTLEAASAKTKDTEANLQLLTVRRQALEIEHKALRTNAVVPGNVAQATPTAEQIRQRSKQLLDEIKKLENTPVVKKQFKYHAPVSRVVDAEERFFECKAGRVTFIDLPAFMQEVRGSLDAASTELKTTWRVERKTAPVGPYRLRFAVERERTSFDTGPAPSQGSFRYGVSEWVVEPITNDRGETLEEALKEKSQFRQLVDPIDARLTTVTCWVYPDSFELFRHLRDHLYERGHDVAGRPLPPGAPIAASRHGTASRGQ
jgi:hypothetical protein